MKRLDKYAIGATLLAGGVVSLYFGYETYAGMFLGVFFTYIKDILGINDNTEPVKEPSKDEMEEVFNEVFDNQI